MIELRKKTSLTVQKPAKLLAFVLSGAISLFLITGCSTFLNATPDCVPLAQGYSAKKPCWIYNHPAESVVVHGSKHFGSNGWLKARQKLFREAITELVIRRYGEEVSVDTKVLKEVGVSHDNQVTKQSQVVSTLQFSTGKDSINIKAEIVDYYYNSGIEKVWVLVREITSKQEE